MDQPGEMPPDSASAQTGIQQHCDIVLGLYGDGAEAFGSGLEQLTLAFAIHLAAMVRVTRRDRQLQKMLSKCDVTGQAKGVLIQRFDIDAVTECSMLARTSIQQRPHLRRPTKSCAESFEMSNRSPKLACHA